jgi:hypothetical protein
MLTKLMKSLSFSSRNLRFRRIHAFLNKRTVVDSFIGVGDVIEVIHNGNNKIGTVQKFEVVKNSWAQPTEIVIEMAIKFEQGLILTCTSDNFQYVRHVKR